MKARTHGSRLALLAAFVLALTGPPATAQQRNDQDEESLTARKKASADVIKLLKQADRKLRRCLELYVDGESFRDIETQGRDAKNLYRDILELEPSNSYASLSIGYVDLILGRATASRRTRENHFSAATSRFREALEKRPGYADAYLYMAQVQALREQYQDAEKSLRLILDSGIEDSQVHSWMAYVLFKTECQGEARKHLARGIELDDPPASARWSRKHQHLVGD